MNLDIRDILDDWPYEPGQVTARKIRGHDGKDKIQMRLDLGLLQMEATGRPDGLRPHGFESLLDYHEHCLEQHRLHRSGEDDYELDSQACESLRTESVMFYHRYLAEYVLEDFEGVERDTIRNLRLMDFCLRYAKEPLDKYILEQYRPYVLMMRARARSRKALRDGDPKAAMSAVRRGIHEIQALRSFGREGMSDGSGEIAVLQAMAKDIEAQIPVDPIRKLRHALAEAVRQENYEEAAAIRDRINQAVAEKRVRDSQETKPKGA
jgi:hypothetical protein